MRVYMYVLFFLVRGLDSGYYTKVQMDETVSNTKCNILA
jgi:hypothetical protein